MPKITDPNNLQVAVNAAAGSNEVVITTATKTIQLTLVGDLLDDAPGKTSGVTAKALYSFLKEEWLGGSPDQSATLRRFKFPLKMIFEGSFIWVNGWSPADIQTRDLIRDAGFQEITGDEYACMVSLGSMTNFTSDLAYYTQAAAYNTTPQDYDKFGEVNENIDISAASTYKKSFLREEGKLFSEYNLLVEQGLQSISFQAYSFPLSNGTDLKRTLLTTEDAPGTDVYILGANAPYNGMAIDYLEGVGFTTFAGGTAYPANSVVKDDTGRWFFTITGGTSTAAITAVSGDLVVTDWTSYFGEEQIGATWYAFNRIVNANGGTDLQTYGFMQANLRETGDINDSGATFTITASQGDPDVKNGEVSELLGEYVGDNLKPAPGVVIRGFDTNSTNSIQHSPIDVDGGGIDTITSLPLTFTEVAFPFVAAGNFNFSQNLVDEAVNADTFYTVYFDYITRNSGSYTLTLSAGAVGDLTWAGTDLDHIVETDYIYISNWVTTTAMDGLYLVGTVGSNTMVVTHQEGATIVTETATVQVDLNPFESPLATIVQTDGGGTPVDMSGTVVTATEGWDFDYTNNIQGGRTANSDAAIRVVAQALNKAEWIEATHTITKATGQNIAVNANDERNYAPGV